MMPDREINNTLFTTLACVALNPALRSVLIFDAPAYELQQLALLLEQLLRCVSVLPVHSYTLAAYLNDEDMWGSLQLPLKTHSGQWPSHARLFSPERNACELQLLTIPNLSNLNLTTTRTCILLIGADVAHLERNGENKHWQPQQCWLAACPSESIGIVSPHLLDRFALRLSWKLLQDLFDPTHRSTHLQTRLSQNGTSNQPIPPPALVAQLKQAVHQHVNITPEALARVMDYLPADQEAYYPRRELALARFAFTLAQLLADPSLSPSHVDSAAQILGFPLLFASTQDVHNSSQPLVPVEAPMPDPELEVISPSPPSLLPISESQPPSELVHLAYIPATSTSSLLPVELLCNVPYPEDEAPIEREAASLKFPTTRFAPRRALHGPIIGTEKSESFYDLALVSTLLTATKFQTLRKRQPDEPLRLEASDLRRYRRGFLPEHLLMLILDYTCVRDNPNWRDSLAPYLTEAYVNRASICIVKIGANDALSPWQARLVSGKSLLVPRIYTAFLAERGAGLPTPLAHGLELAVGHLRMITQHGRGSITQITLIVLSDGRGNVPLEVSHANQLSDAIVSREGLEDALTQAYRFRSLRRCETIVFNPQSRYYPKLPKLLAEALDATLLAIPLPSEMEEIAL